jgi:DNA helicase-2/ATP-dependent DNA helicase PcrA
LGNFVKLIEGARFETHNLPLPEMVKVVLDISTLLIHYQTEKEGADRIENLEQLINAATLFVSEEGYGHAAPALAGPPSQLAASLLSAPDGIQIIDADAALPTVMSPLSAFLSHASLEAGDNQAQAGQDALQLMTVHAAKGLEFDAVFITGLEEGLFPHENSAKEETGVEEERRLMYVAITRARKRLYITFSQTRMLHGQIRYNTRSRFFDEMPEESLKWLSPKVQANWFGNKKSAWDEAPESGVNAIAQGFAKNQGGSGWRIGQGVMHAKFGEGVIVNIEGSGTNARAHINFGQFGMKLLDLSIAKLDKIGS